MSGADTVGLVERFLDQTTAWKGVTSDAWIGSAHDITAGQMLAVATEIATLRAQVAGGVRAEGLARLRIDRDYGTGTFDDMRDKAANGSGVYAKIVGAELDKARQDLDDIRALTPDATPAGSEREAVLPHGCTGSTLSFVPGMLAIEQDGSGTLTFPEESLTLDEGDDECGPCFSVDLPASELLALRDWLNQHLPPALAAAPTSGAEGVGRG